MPQKCVCRFNVGILSTCNIMESRFRFLYYRRYYYFETWRREIFTRKSSTGLEILVARRYSEVSVSLSHER